MDNHHRLALGRRQRRQKERLGVSPTELRLDELLLFAVVAICATVAAVFGVFSSEALAGVFGALTGYAGKAAVEGKRR